MVSGYFSSWAESHKMPWNMCGSQIMFGMLGRLEHEDLGALVAPRPLLVETGTEDLLVPGGGGDRVGAAHPPRLRRSTAPATAWCTTSSRAGHQWHGTEALPFLDRWLGHEGSGRSD